MWVSRFSRWSLFSPYSKSYSVCVSFSTFFRFSPYPYPGVCVSHFPCFSVFSPYSMSYCVHFSFFFSFFTAFRAIYHFLQCLFRISMIFSFFFLTPLLLCISNFLRFWVFFRIVHVKQWLCLLFHFLKFPYHNPGPTVCISHFSRFSLFLTIFHILQCVCLIFVVCHYTHYIPSSYSVCFSFSPFFDFLAIYRSYSVHISFFTFFTVACHVPGPTMWVSQFSRWYLSSPYFTS